jgi:hypothetical protein
MKRFFAITLVMLLSSAMFFVVVCEGAGNADKKPASGMWSGTIYDVGFCAGSTPEAPVFQAINVGKGVSTLTGKSDWFSVFCTYCIKPNPDSPIGCDEMDGFGWAIITAADGDKLHLELTSVGVDLTATPPIWTELETVVGGTGRFDGASGESHSKGTWTSGSSFPSGEDVKPLLIMPPQGWVGTNEGYIEF